MHNKVTVILSVILTVLSGSFIYVYQSKTKEISELISDSDNLRSELVKLREENSELEEKLSNVKHFDDDANIGMGYSDDATNYTGEAIEAQIDGEFNGWDGETIFKLTNGSIWQQASYAYTYHYSYRPDIIIYRKDGSYYMKVADVDDVILVRRLK